MPDGHGWTVSVGRLVAQASYLFAPLLTSTVVSGVVLRYNLMPTLARPIDGGTQLRSRRLFGDNKTWRGFVCALIGCSVAVAIQKYAIGDRAGSLAVVNYRTVNVLIFASVLAAGSTLGELPNSFAKRQLGVSPGCGATGVLAPFFYVWDQIDVLLVIWPLLLFWIRPNWALVLVSVLLVFLVHQAVSVVGYLISARTSMFH